MKVGVFPIRNHYYEPQFDYRNSKRDFSEDRNLQGIDWNVPGQLQLLKSFIYSDELEGLPQDKRGPLEYYLNNEMFKSGDAEYWYQLIRAKKPKRIFEIGSGNSTLMAVKALNQNLADDQMFKCEHVCIEPYEAPWLEQAGVHVVREKVENVELGFFSQLQENDILFIDSSHIIRPQGDVLFEFLELLPTLNKGVIVHVHDIFSPRNYIKSWLADKVILWNEQYLLEAFLTQNDSWKVIGALNFLHHNHYENLKPIAPYLTPEREPVSFYLQKIA
jgi:predicted O-methyltransferase YrrM